MNGLYKTFPDVVMHQIQFSFFRFRLFLSSRSHLRCLAWQYAAAFLCEFRIQFHIRKSSKIILRHSFARSRHRHPMRSCKCICLCLLLVLLNTIQKLYLPRCLPSHPSIRVGRTVHTPRCVVQSNHSVHRGVIFLPVGDAGNRPCFTL